MYIYIYIYIHITKFEKKTKVITVGKIANCKNLYHGKHANGKKQISRRSRGRSMEILCKQITIQTRSSTLVKFTR